MIAPEHAVVDDGFWNVAEQEKKAREGFEKQIETLGRVINLGRRALALRGQPGFEDFVNSVRDLREHAKNQLVASVDSDRQMRVLQGKAQALSDILALLADTEKSVEALEARREALQNELAAVVTDDGKVITDPLGAKT